MGHRCLTAQNRTTGVSTRPVERIEGSRSPATGLLTEQSQRPTVQVTAVESCMSRTLTATREQNSLVLRREKGNDPPL